MDANQDTYLDRQSAIAEAHVLYGMIGEKNTVEELRELIASPPKMERALRAFARTHVQDAHWIEASLKFREAVAREFERLVRDGAHAADLPEVEEVGLDASITEVAFAQP